MRTFHCTYHVSHKDSPSMDDWNIYRVSHVVYVSSDDRPGVTSPSRSSRFIREIQAVWSFCFSFAWILLRLFEKPKLKINRSHRSFLLLPVRQEKPEKGTSLSSYGVRQAIFRIWNRKSAKCAYLTSRARPSRSEQLTSSRRFARVKKENPPLTLESLRLILVNSMFCTLKVDIEEGVCN